MFDVKGVRNSIELVDRAPNIIFSFSFFFCEIESYKNIGSMVEKWVYPRNAAAMLPTQKNVFIIEQSW